MHARPYLMAAVELAPPLSLCTMATMPISMGRPTGIDRGMQVPQKGKLILDRRIDVGIYLLSRNWTLRAGVISLSRMVLANSPRSLPSHRPRRWQTPLARPSEDYRRHAIVERLEYSCSAASTAVSR